MFAVIKTYDPDHYDYYVIRCQRRNFKPRMNILYKRFPHMQILLKIAFSPNSINLYNRMKELLKDKINWEGNYFDITDDDVYCEEDMIFDIRKIYNPLK